VAGLVVIVGGVSIMVSLYNSMSGRRRNIAIMRAIGARRTTILSVVMLEAGVLCAAGSLLGLVLGHGLAALAGSLIASFSGVAVTGLRFDLIELAVVLSTFVLGALAGVVPALSAYKTEISEGLTTTT
jgi:putative ABC transport system permease protein